MWIEGIILKKLLSLTRAAVDKYNMIESGDKIAVGVSGGKDSVALLCALARLRKFYPKPFELVAITLDYQFGGKPQDFTKIKELCVSLDVPYIIKETNLWEIIFEIRKEKNPCALCAKMRRGILHDVAKEQGCNKIALGHHADDAAETFLMNLLNGGNIGSFSPVSYLSNKKLYQIRPFVFAFEHDVERAVKNANLPIVKSNCPADKNTEREKTKLFLKELEQNYPSARKKILGAMERGHISGW